MSETLSDRIGTRPVNEAIAEAMPQLHKLNIGWARIFGAPRGPSPSHVFEPDGTGHRSWAKAVNTDHQEKLGNLNNGKGTRVSHELAYNHAELQRICTEQVSDDYFLSTARLFRTVHRMAAGR